MFRMTTECLLSLSHSRNAEYESMSTIHPIKFRVFANKKKPKSLDAVMPTMFIPSTLFPCSKQKHTYYVSLQKCWKCG